MAKIDGPSEAEAPGNKDRGIVGIIVEEAGVPVAIIVAENRP